MLPYRALTKNAGGVIPLAERCEVKVRDVRRWLAADGWVLVGTGGYWWVLVGTGGYWCVRAAAISSSSIREARWSPLRASAMTSRRVL
jgi:hypothetical protein